MVPEAALAGDPNALLPPSRDASEIGGEAPSGDREVDEIHAGDPIRILVDYPPQIWVTGTAVASGRDSLVVAADGDTVVIRCSEIVRVQIRYDPDGDFDTTRLLAGAAFAGLGAWAGWGLTDNFGEPRWEVAVLGGMVGFVLSMVVFGMPEDPYDPRWEDSEGVRILPIAGVWDDSGIGVAWRF
ncbi:MAG: hypothetical protein GY838_10065 [bacterium]|nr:hypothetical protein [bacterium]